MFVYGRFKGAADVVMGTVGSLQKQMVLLIILIVIQLIIVGAVFWFKKNRAKTARSFFG
ncbi:hypothetical protein [Bacillus sp. MUM 116]|uniref:hypothetical protein n=1 Tax=Bacillus sp. MUM 116 TaxID=1678002 RepID=UPI0015A56E61|nr:hypothetical protein [Bacillus sp. MUM 116]